MDERTFEHSNYAEEDVILEDMFVHAMIVKRHLWMVALAISVLKT
jgi:hypothetical protein